MANRPRWFSMFLKILSYVLVAAVASACSFLIAGAPTKLDALAQIIEKQYIGEVDETAMADAAAEAMVETLGDRWSYYIPASEYGSFKQNRTNSYVGIGITISAREDGIGYDIQLVEPDGPAQKAGVLPGDILIRADGQTAAQMEMDDLRALIQGESGTKVSIAVLREGQELTFEITRKKIQVAAATAQMLEGNVGLVTIENFHDNCAEQSIEAVEQLVEQGAQSLIFDVRYNGGGYVEELLDLLDYLLPEGVLFRSVDYKGKEEVDTSDADCVEMPMAVLINGSSYSAAEFFAAALEEYDWAVTVGEQTSGKGYFQNTIALPDGSAVNLSTGKYLTPNGVNLQEQGGLTPNIPVAVDEDTAALIYSGLLPAEEDPQVQAAVQALKGA